MSVGDRRRGPRQASKWAWYHHGTVFGDVWREENCCGRDLGDYMTWPARVKSIEGREGINYPSVAAWAAGLLGDNGGLLASRAEGGMSKQMTTVSAEQQCW